MDSNWIIALIAVSYFVLTSFVGFLQYRKVGRARDFALAQLSPWHAATFLAGFTLGGASTYGVAGDTIKFGFTYLLWFPISIALGWWVTGFFFARSYYRLQGITLPALLGKRYGRETRNAAMISMMIYAIFVIIIEIYTLAMVILALAPNIDLWQAALISMVACVGTVAFSGIMGASVTNMIHSVMMVVSFGLVFITLWQGLGGWGNAVDILINNLDQFSAAGVNREIWLSPTGLGIGVIGQILLAKSGRLGGISSVSNLAASCRSEEDAVKAFRWAGFISAVPPALACGVGIMAAAYLGPEIGDLPIYSSIGIAVGELNPILAGVFLAAVGAAILSTFSPVAVLFSTVFVEDIIKQFFSIEEKLERMLFPISVILISVICAGYVIFVGIEHVMPFVFSTAFPSTIPITVVALLGLRTTLVNRSSAFWAIVLGVSISLTWGLVLDNPLDIHNMYLALVIPLVVIGFDSLRGKMTFKPSDQQNEQR